MKLTNTHRLILEMLLHHPEGIRREDINEVLKREGERVLDDRRRLYKFCGELVGIRRKNLWEL